MKEEKNIPFKNYVILAVMLLLSIVGVIYFYMWYSEFENSKINTPVMDKYLSLINYNELDDYLIENKNFIVYISELNDEKTRMFEKKFKNIIDDYSFNDIMLYLNLTEEKKNNSLYNDIKMKYKFESLPCLVIFKDGDVYDVYNIAYNDYDIELFVSYLKIEGVIDD